ncbi:MAG: acyl-CoA thioesterase [Gammaproteobacteria bacterium]|nr:acyl-CoA thioesterase [Gammaproteobacteria bacterium]
MIFKCNFEVRDTEIDMDGIVSNYVYFVYLQHARHKYLESLGCGFNTQIQNNQSPVLLATQTNFLQSLKSQDQFYVTCLITSANSRIKFNCYQEIYRSSDDKLILTSTNTITWINNNKTDPRKRFYIPETIKKQISS